MMIEAMTLRAWLRLVLGVAWLAPASAGCLNSGVSKCADGRYCASGLLCDDDNGTCVNPAVCTGDVDGLPCVALGIPRGNCFQEACLPVTTVAAGSVSTPVLAAGAEDFAIAWITTTNGWTGDVQFVRVDPDRMPSVSAPPVIISGEQHTAQGLPQLASNGTDYATTWFTRIDSPSQIDIYKWNLSFAVLDAGGMPSGGIVTEPSPVDGPTLAWDADGWAVTWADGTYGNWEISLQKFTNGMARVFLPKKRVATTSGQDFGPSVALAGQTNRLALAWYEREQVASSYSRHVRLAIRSDFGAADGPVVEVTNSPAENFAGIRVAAGDSTFGVSWATVQPRAGYPDEYTVFFRPYTPDSQSVSNGPIPLSSSTNNPAQIFFYEGRYWLVWSQGVDIKIARMTEEGAIADISTLIANLPSRPEGIALARGAKRLALAWREGDAPNQRIVLQFVPIPNS